MKRGAVARVLFAFGLLVGAGVTITRVIDRHERAAEHTTSRFELPLRFVAADDTSPAGDDADHKGRARFFAHGSRHAIFFEPGRVVFSFLDSTRTSGVAFALVLLGSDPSVRIEGRRPMRAHASYFSGFARAPSRAGVPTYGEVVYRSAWPGVDVVFHEEAGRLKWELVVAPGANPRAIRLAWQGVDGVELDALGRLRITTAAGPFEEPAPVTYQELDGRRVAVPSGFLVKQGEVTFELGNYDWRSPLVIDPALVYSTFLGGGAQDAALAVAVGAGGQIYVTGQTVSPDFPGELGPFSVKHGATDAFVARIDPFEADDDSLVYATFLGGDGPDSGSAIAVDESGCAYVTGATQSSDFPVTANALDDELNGAVDGFLVKLNATGSALLYSSFLGGSFEDLPSGIAVRTVAGAHEVYVAGTTGSPDFPAAGSPPFNGGVNDPGFVDAFATRLTLAASNDAVFDWATFVGGAGDDTAAAIAVDGSGRAILVGDTASTDFPTTAGAFDADHNGGLDAFVARLGSDGSCCQYATFLGGSGSDQAFGVALDARGHAYVTGRAGPGFPTSAGAFDPTHNGGEDAFVARLDPSATGAASRVYATYLGGDGNERGRGIAVAPSTGLAMVVGETTSPGFPVTAGAVDGTLRGRDAWLMAIDPSGDSVLYGTFLGGRADDGASSVALDGDNTDEVAIAGVGQAGFPVTSSAFQASDGGGDDDAFVASLQLGPQLCLGTLSRALDRLVRPAPSPVAALARFIALELNGARQLTERGKTILATVALRGVQRQVALLAARGLLPARPAAELGAIVARCLPKLAPR